MRDLRRSPLFNIFINDIELFGLAVGLRPVAKKEGPDADQLMTISPELLSDDYFVLKNDRTGCTYLSEDPGLVEQLLDMENREISGGDPQQRKRTIHEIGLALGYPDCCASEFAGYRTQDDQNVMASIIRRENQQAGSPVIRNIPWQLNFLPPMAGPVFWYPCCLRCNESLLLADRYLKQIKQIRPEHAAIIQENLTGVILTVGRWDFVMFYGDLKPDNSVWFKSWRSARNFHPVPQSSPAFSTFMDSLPASGRLWIDGKKVFVAEDESDKATAVFDAPEHGMLLLEYR